MRPVLIGDIIEAAQAISSVGQGARATFLDRLLANADAADAYRKRFGRSHPDWGNGSLMSVSRRHILHGRLDLSDSDYCLSIAQVLERLVAHRYEKAGLNRR